MSGALSDAWVHLQLDPPRKHEETFFFLPSPLLHPYPLQSDLDEEEIKSGDDSGDSSSDSSINAGSPRCLLHVMFLCSCIYALPLKQCRSSACIYIPGTYREIRGDDRKVPSQYGL